MLGFRYLAVLIIGLIFVGGALFGLNFSNAQQMPPATNNQKSVSPSPTVSPTPEIIEEDDEVIKIDGSGKCAFYCARPQPPTSD